MTEQFTQPITTIDYHTGGEPFRIVTGGVAPPTGATMLERRATAIAELDHVRAFVVNEPRGHADMYGCFVTPPDDDGAAFGLVCFHKDGFPTACGHGTIAAVTWALHSGLVAAVSPMTTLSVDVPAGRHAVEADVDSDGRVGEVRITNVTSWVAATGIHVDAVGRWWTVDISYGGAFYASVRAADGGLAVRAEDLDDLTTIGRAIKRAMDKHRSVIHPSDDRLSGCYGTIWWEDELPVPGRPESVRQRNVTVFADGQVDRSPCGSGTSARLALLHHHGLLRTGELLRHEGIVGTAFSSRVLAAATTPTGQRGVVTQVGGRAHRTGSHEFTLDPADEIGIGFQLR